MTSKYALFAGKNKQQEPAYASQIRECFPSFNKALNAGRSLLEGEERYRWFEIIEIASGSTVSRHES